MALPVKFGGIGISDPTTTADRHNATSYSCSSILSDAIIRNDVDWNFLDHYRQLMARKILGKAISKGAHQAVLGRLYPTMTPKCR